MVVLFVACIVILVFSVVKSSDAYKIAVARAKSDQRVVAALGTPIKEGMFSSGKTNVNGPSGEADIGIPISGPKGKATIYVVATKSEGQWSFSKLDVKIEGTGETIDLNETESVSNEEGPATKKGATDTNVEVESITLAREEGDELKPVKNFKRADNPEHILVTLHCFLGHTANDERASFLRDHDHRLHSCRHPIRRARPDSVLRRQLSKISGTGFDAVPAAAAKALSYVD